MTLPEAFIKIVLLHTNGHQIWLAPWVVWFYIVVFVLWGVSLVFDAWSRKK